MRKIFKTTFSYAAVFLGVVLCVFIAGNTMFSVKSYELEFSELPESFDGFKIIQLSDLHDNTFGNNNKWLINAVDKESPDIIVMTGDMLNSTDEDFSNLKALCQLLESKYSVYYIIGNHEQAFGNVKRQTLYSNLASAGVVVLDNEKAVVEKGNDTIDIYGLWFNLRFYSDQTDENILSDPETYYFDNEKCSAILGKCDTNQFSLLLTHNPVYFDTYVSWGADLTLSGHMHGGMIRIPFLGGIYSPEKTFFPEYDAGLFESGGSKMIVSRGLGNGQYGFRLFNTPEIVSITLKCKA